jgi:hypothetical protein
MKSIKLSPLSPGETREIALRGALIIGVVDQGGLPYLAALESDEPLSTVVKRKFMMVDRDFTHDNPLVGLVPIGTWRQFEQLFEVTKTQLWFVFERVD